MIKLVANNVYETAIFTLSYMYLNRISNNYKSTDVMMIHAKPRFKLGFPLKLQE